MKQVNFEAGKYYHLFNRGNNKLNIFFEEGNYLYFLDLVKKHLNPNIDVLAYCLLKNHFHFVIRIKDEDLPHVHKSGKKSCINPFPIFSMPTPKQSTKNIIEREAYFKSTLKEKRLVPKITLSKLLLMFT